MWKNHVREIKRISGLDAEALIRKGKPEEVISEVIASDHDIHLLVLGADVDGDPGPLIKSFSRSIAQCAPHAGTCRAG